MAERLAISRVRQARNDMLDRESISMPLSAKINQTKHVGCMTVLGSSRRKHYNLPSMRIGRYACFV